MLYSPTIGGAIAARYWFLWVRCRACRTVTSIDLRTLDRHRDAAVTGLIPALSCRSCRPNFNRAFLPFLYSHKSRRAGSGHAGNALQRSTLHETCFIERRASGGRVGHRGSSNRRTMVRGHCQGCFCGVISAEFEELSYPRPQRCPIGFQHLPTARHLALLQGRRASPDKNGANYRHEKVVKPQGLVCAKRLQK